jgi:hypothetical protein
MTLIMFSIFVCCNNSKIRNSLSAQRHDKLNSDTNCIENHTPPFNINCPCTPGLAGELMISKNNFNYYLLCKNWDSNIYACSYMIDEEIDNLRAPDSSITFLRIHLLDLENFIIPNNSTEYGNDTIKKYVIAIFTHDIKNKKWFSSYDPFKTGKYSSPKDH